MSAKIKSVLWEAPPHTLAKIAILQAYLSRWFEILGSKKYRQNLWYIDGFAGPGEYTNSPTGSPVAAITSASEALQRVGVPWKAGIRFLSIEPLLDDVGEIDLRGIHWVIVGGESGLKARPMKAEWVESIKYQCEQDSVAFFFKQWGGWGADGKKRPKKNNGRLLAGKIWDAMPGMIDR